MKRKKPNTTQPLQFVGTQLEENYLLDSLMEKLEFGSHKEEPRNEKFKKKLLFNIFLIFVLINITACKFKADEGNWRFFFLSTA